MCKTRISPPAPTLRCLAKFRLLINRIAMKKSIGLLTLLAILLSCFNASAGEEEPRRRRRGPNIGAHLNVGPIFRGIYSVNAELGLTKNTSVVLTAAFLNIPFTTTVSNGFTVESNRYNYRGYAITPEFRYYFNPSRRPGLDGWFMGAYAKVRSAATADDALAQIVNTSMDPFNPVYEVQYFGATSFGFGAGLTSGYMYAHKSGLCISVWGGLGYFFVNETEYTSPPVTNLENFLVIDIRSGLSVGYRF